MIVKLTKRTVDALAPSNRAILAYDTDLKGFGVRVALSGSLSWFIEYRPGAGGRRVAKRRMYFGGREFTPEQARQAAKEMLASVALGKDPAAVRREERESETFREFAERYLREEAEAKLKPGTVTNYRICIRKHTVPEIGSIKLHRIPVGRDGMAPLPLSIPPRRSGTGLVLCCTMASNRSILPWALSTAP